MSAKEKTVAKAPTKKPAVSLAAFANNRKIKERKATCAICRIPENVREEIRLARTRKVERVVVIEWLASIGHKVDDLDFQTHNAGLHDQRETRPA